MSFPAKIIFFYLLWSSSFCWAFHVVLDPGHGGSDKGAMRGAVRESDLVLKIALDLKTRLEKNKDFQVSLTRPDDHNVSLPDRVKKAEQLRADLFVSLHANAALDARAKGIEFYFQNSLPPDEESLYLASVENQNLKETAQTANEEEPSKKNDVAAILEDLHRQDRIEKSLRLNQTLSSLWDAKNDHEKISIKQAPFYVISKTNMPAVLIEIGFITNAKEVKKLLSPQYQSEISSKIYRALVAYKEKGDKEIPVRQSAE